VVIVDTNVLAGLFIDGPFSADARALYSEDPDWRSEPFALVEFTNVLATQIRARRLTAAAGQVLVDRAQAVFGNRLHEVDHGSVLDMAIRQAVSAYDARFLCVALAYGSKLVTEDAALRRKAPGLTRSLSQALGR